MDISGYLYHNLPYQLENREEIQDGCYQQASKLNFHKSLLRIYSPEPSIQGDSNSNENDQMYEIGIREFNIHKEEKNGNLNLQENCPSKKVQKTKKLNKKRQYKNRPLSEEEFIDIMKRIEQFQCVMKMIDHMTMILKEYQNQLLHQNINRTLR
ncbi:unnamed protein product (macronuclear) [Paramecium tetraurelia]|uniref:Uncharacterized protein n=1 Tax=Paramecium tetraurelia TaxID=5888 RepID=A0CL05_PARTE|nr:uncharacterized protein GSPATT00008019001 [Paramecium tetraurelia]CAK71472.1 unnamed protein product [Paramecium tetraurelia]|eukprot:XP_001438869.1 hypothetical protein (macronuclear) [Paramecium tetraurelia strain d4-2]